MLKEYMLQETLRHQIPTKGETRRMLCGNLGEVEEEAPQKSIQKNIDICSSSSATEQSLAQGPPTVGLDCQIYTTPYNSSAVEISCRSLIPAQYK